MKLSVNDLRQTAKDLRRGDRIELSGYVYTARDAAHMRIVSLLDSNAPLPFALKDAVIYYAGPTATPPGLSIGSVGPTTAGRMDPFTPRLLNLGLAAVIGKGERNRACIDAFRRNGALYLCAVGGAGALAALCVETAEITAFPELGCEAVRRLLIKDFPLTVGVDTYGGDIFADGRAEYAAAN